MSKLNATAQQTGEAVSAAGSGSGQYALYSEDDVQACIEIIKSEQRAAICLFQRRLRLGYTRAAAIMDELERRKIVGPAKGAEPRDIYLETAPNESSSPTRAENARGAQDQ